MAITVMGTHRNIPGTPQSDPQRPRERRITSGLRFKEFPIRRGSRKFPTRTWAATTPPIVKPILVGSSNWMRARIEGKAVASIEPTVGIKLKKKISITQNAAKSRPTDAIIAKLSIPVVRLVRVLIPMYLRVSLSI